MGREEVAIAQPAMAFGRGAGSAPQHHLAAHEFSVVFAEGAPLRAIAGVRKVCTCRPLPHILVYARPQDIGVWPQAVLLELIIDIMATRGLPLEFRRQPASRPLGVCRGLVKADVTYRLVILNGPQAMQYETVLQPNDLATGLSRLAART